MSKRDYQGNVVRYGRTAFPIRNSTRIPMRKAAYKRPRVSPKLATAIKTVVSREEEHKESTLYSLNTPLPPVSNGGWTASSISIAPSSTGFVIPQGTGQGNRIGNQIRTRKAVVRGIINPTVYDGTTNTQPMPTQIRMLIFKDKFNKTGQPAAVALDLFNTGSTSVGPQNDLVDMILDVNTDRYTVYADRVLKVGNANYGGSGSLAIWQSMTNNDFSFNASFSVDITKFLPSVVTYNDSASAPMSDNLWMIFLPVQATGGATGATQIVNTLTWMATYNYTDA